MDRSTGRPLGAVADRRHAVPFCRNAARKRHERCGGHPSKKAPRDRDFGPDACRGAAAGGPARDLGVFSTMPVARARAQPDHGTGGRGPMGRRTHAPPPGLVDQGCCARRAPRGRVAHAQSCALVLAKSNDLDMRPRSDSGRRQWAYRLDSGRSTMAPQTRYDANGDRLAAAHVSADRGAGAPA